MKIKIKDNDRKPRKTVTKANQEKSDAVVFFDALERNTSFDSREPNKSLVDSGLIIFKKTSPTAVAGILSTLPKGKTILMKLDNKHFADEFFKKLVMANREGQWLAVDCSCDPAPAIIQTLKQISQDNEFTLPHFEGKELFAMKMNPKSRVIFSIADNILEKEITYPYFMDLFGPILRTNK